jgi:F-type H+-transporting ATPase subunit a
MTKKIGLRTEILKCPPFSHLWVLLIFLFSSQELFAGGGLVHPINYYEILAHFLDIDPMWQPTLAALLATFFIAMLGIRYRSRVMLSQNPGRPEGKFGLRFLVEAALDGMYGLARDAAGDRAKEHFTLLAAIFIYIVLNNLMGLVPGFAPATLSMDTNVAMGLVVFFYYNWAGIKEHGGGYIKHFFGPVAFIAPLMFCIELISHGSRPLSLGLRLAGNIFGDHTLLTVFTTLTYVIFPAGLMFFGLLVAVVQSYVFALLSSIYISMAISHDH